VTGVDGLAGTATVHGSAGTAAVHGWAGTVAVHESAGVSAVHRSVDSPVGRIVVVASEGRLTELRFEKTGAPLEAGRKSTEGASMRVLEEATLQLAEYYAGRRTRFDLPLDPGGTEFERTVWARVEQIPYGATVSYGELAIGLGRPGAARAVGRANAHNPLPLFIPCHRVIGASGSLTGYGGGIDAKRFLLALESSGAHPLPPLRVAPDE
jgi:methylated-DNA-[protein]-cysteine S-methyltransferase